MLDGKNTEAATRFILFEFSKSIPKLDIVRIQK